MSEYELLCTWAVCSNLTSRLHWNFTTGSFVWQLSCFFGCVESRESFNDSYLWSYFVEVALWFPDIFAFNPFISMRVNLEWFTSPIISIAAIHWFPSQKCVATRAVVHCLGAWAAMDVALISVFGDGVELVMGLKLVSRGKPWENHRKTISPRIYGIVSGL